MLQFDPTRHAYTDGRHYYRSVTGVLRAAGRVGEWGTPDALTRGKLVHALTLALETAGTWLGTGHDLPWPDGYPLPPMEIAVRRGSRYVLRPDAELARYCDAYWQWRCLYRPRWTMMEHPLARPDLNLAGTPDRIGILRGWPTVLEVKTGGAASWHGLQLAGYDLLDEGPMERHRVALYLAADGSFKLRSYADPADRFNFYVLLGSAT